MASSTAQNIPAESRALNPFVTYDPAVMQKSNTRWKAVWLVAALVTAVAFTALATAAIIYTTVHFPIHLPTVSILVFAAGMPTSFRAFKYLWDKKDHFAQEASIDAQLIKHMQANTTGDPKLKSVQARYKYFQAEKMRWKTFSQELLDEIKTPQPLADVNFKDAKAIKKFEKQATKQELAKMGLYKAALAHLKSAYFLHLMDNPYENRPTAEFFEFAIVDPQARLLAKGNGDKTAETFLKTSSRCYTEADLLRKTPEQLKREIFSGKTGWFR
ncbi:MAG: hypothetical protein P0S96_05265 [Simkaniaceae bacterium]|nr:hypothetical protein [Candidatus Sacchlamyda saccharinae]